MKIAICDDLTECRLSVKCFVKEYFKLHHIECSIDEFKTGTDLISVDENYDILFLDIELGDLNGIDVAKEIRRKHNNTVILVITAYHQYLDDAAYYRAIGIRKKYKEKLQDAFFNFGIALHPLQDMIAHSGPGGDLGVPVSTVNIPGKIYVAHAVYLHLGKKYDDPNGQYLDTKYTKGQVCDFFTRFFCLGIAQELENRRMYEPLNYIFYI